MGNIGFVIGTAAFTFTVTNIDIFCLLIVFFAKVKVDPDCTNLNVWIAQAIGFSIIIGISLLGALLGASVDLRYVSLLGFIPILMGLKSMRSDWNWRRLWRFLTCSKKVSKSIHIENNAGEVEMTEIRPIESKITDPDMSSDRSVRSLSSMESGESGESSESSESGGSGDTDCAPGDNADSTELDNPWIAFLNRYVSMQLIEMVSITIANGGDNVAIYLPIFAVCTPRELLFTVITYYVLLACFLVTSYFLLGNKLVIDCLHKYGHYLVPVSLVAMGVYILTDSILFEL